MHMLMHRIMSQLPAEEVYFLVQATATCRKVVRYFAQLPLMHFSLNILSRQHLQQVQLTHAACPWLLG